jgi:hypothetical protein
MRISIAVHSVLENGSNRTGKIVAIGRAVSRSSLLDTSVPAITIVKQIVLSTAPAEMTVFNATAPKKCPSIRSNWIPQSGHFWRMSKSPNRLNKCLEPHTAHARDKPRRSSFILTEPICGGQEPDLRYDLRLWRLVRRHRLKF